MANTRSFRMSVFTIRGESASVGAWAYHPDSLGGLLMTSDSNQLTFACNTVFENVAHMSEAALEITMDGRRVVIEAPIGACVEVSRGDSGYSFTIASVGYLPDEPLLIPMKPRTKLFSCSLNVRGPASFCILGNMSLKHDGRTFLSCSDGPFYSSAIFASVARAAFSKAEQRAAFDLVVDYACADESVQLLRSRGASFLAFVDIFRPKVSFGIDRHVFEREIRSLRGMDPAMSAPSLAIRASWFDAITSAEPIHISDVLRAVRSYFVAKLVGHHPGGDVYEVVLNHWDNMALRHSVLMECSRVSATQIVTIYADGIDIIGDDAVPHGDCSVVAGGTVYSGEDFHHVLSALIAAVDPFPPIIDETEPQLPELPEPEIIEIAEEDPIVTPGAESAAAAVPTSEIPNALVKKLLTHDDVVDDDVMSHGSADASSCSFSSSRSSSRRKKKNGTSAVLAFKSRAFVFDPTHDVQIREVSAADTSRVHGNVYTISGCHKTKGDDLVGINIKCETNQRSTTVYVSQGPDGKKSDGSPHRVCTVSLYPTSATEWVLRGVSAGSPRAPDVCIYTSKTRKNVARKNHISLFHEISFEHDLVSDETRFVHEYIVKQWLTFCAQEFDYTMVATW